MSRHCKVSFFAILFSVLFFFPHAAHGRLAVHHVHRAFPSHSRHIHRQADIASVVNGVGIPLPNVGQSSGKRPTYSSFAFFPDQSGDMSFTLHFQAEPRHPPLLHHRPLIRLAPPQRPPPRRRLLHPHLIPMPTIRYRPVVPPHRHRRVTRHQRAVPPLPPRLATPPLPLPPLPTLPPLPLPPPFPLP